MNYEEFSRFEKAIELFLEDESEKFTEAIKRYQQKRGIAWRLFKYYSIFGEPNTVKSSPKKIEDVSLEELYQLIESRGVARSALQPYMEKAQELFDKHGISAMNRGWHHKYDSDQ